jgi:antitoxin ParD1/3/4
MIQSYWMERLTMPTLSRHTVTLGTRHQQYIERKLAEGEYASTSEVVRAGIAALAERDARIDLWFREDVLPAVEEAEANPETLEDLATVKARLLAKLQVSKKQRQAS